MKRLICAFLTLAMLLSFVPVNVFAADELTEIDYANEEVYEMSEEDYANWKQSTFTDDSMLLMSTAGGYIRNEYIEAYINGTGHYTMGTTGGNPDTSSDDDKILLFGHPDSTTTETLIRIDGTDYFFNSSNATISADGTECVATIL